MYDMFYYFVIKYPDGHKEVKSAGLVGPSSAKRKATNFMKRAKFDKPCTVNNNGKWFTSISEPEWILRKKPKRIFKNDIGECATVFIVRGNHPDLDAIRDKDQ